MFKLCPTKILVGIIAWLTVMVVLGVNAARAILEGFGLSVAVGLSLIVAIVQLIFALIFVTQFWRVIWRRFPKLNDWIYPDLNGVWDVELRSNFSRIDALLRSAKGDGPPLDFRAGSEGLPSLKVVQLRARIRQSWAKFEMDLWNPNRTGPIKDSRTLLVEPFRGAGGRHGLAYIFEQTNETDVISDDNKFRGAAWIERDKDNANVLCGRTWNDRMWRLGMNTAAEIRFIRRRSDS